jgi:hypothetical protein
MSVSKIRLVETDHRGEKRIFESPSQEGTHTEDYTMYPKPIVFENGFVDAYRNTWRV